MSECSRGTIEPNDELLFSLDIGTRNVVGIVGKKEKEKFVVADFEMMEHPSRAMYDGQIHDINRVAEVAKEVKEKLEKRLGFPLKHVAIAAAGRALKTYRVQIGREIDYSKEIDNTLISSLEMEGIQRAQEKLEQEGNISETKYYCVGYTVVNYFLNEGLITSLKGHRGNKIGADILATFLPHVVVDSLYSVMDKIELEVLNLTLEPIAAIHAAIPPKLRLLNLALVDIGAGTSDIAITQDGTIVAYAMASVAGDEITEALAKEFLLDFDSAEKLKLQLNKKESHTFCDIVGILYTVTTDEIIERIASSIEMLASEIAEKVLGNNGKPPSAVFCIGGGSQIPTLTKHIAEKLGIVKERVVVRGTEIIENIIFHCEKLEGPEFITPIGIGIVSLKDHEQDFIDVYVNGNQIRLFNAKQLLVSDALIRMGFSARKLIARRGSSLHIKVNGKEKVISGELGEPAKIFLNNKPVSLDTPIKNKDILVVESAIDGSDAKITVREFIGEFKTVNYNGVDMNLISDLTVNGKEVPAEYILKDRDEVSYKEIVHISDLFEKFNIDPNTYDVFVNDRQVNRNYVIQNMDKVITCEKNKKMKVSERGSIQTGSEDIKSKENMEITVNDEAVSIEIGSKPPIFVDIFKYINFDITRTKGTLRLLLNGKRANYTDYLKNGDIIEIKWE